MVLVACWVNMSCLWWWCSSLGSITCWTMILKMFDVLILQSPPSALKDHIYPRESWKRSIQSRRGQFKSMAVFPAGSGETYLLCVSTLHTVKSFRWMHGIKYVVYIFIFIFFSAWFPQLWKTASVQEGVCKKYYQVFEVFYKAWSFTNETFLVLSGGKG